jgi:uncharacterized membrane protein YfcA
VPYRHVDVPTNPALKEQLMPGEQGEYAVSEIEEAVLREAGNRRNNPAFARVQNVYRAVKAAGLPVTVSASLGVLALYFEASHWVFSQLSPWVMLAIFVAASISSIAGFAFSAICGAILFHLMVRPVHIVEIMILCSIAIQCLSVVTLKNAINVKHLARFVSGGIIGLPLGVYLLTHISSSIYMKCMGGFLVIYGSYMLVRRPFAIRCAGFFGDYLAGFLGGITGGLAAFPGAFVTIWCGLKGWSKEQQRGVYQPYILIMQILALGLIFVLGTPRSPADDVDLHILSYVPAALLGTWCGIAIFRRLSEVQFIRSVNVLLIASGIGLIS